MARRKKVKGVGFICLLAFAVMCVLTVLNFALPLLSSTSKGEVVGIGGSSSQDYGLFDLLDGMSDKSLSDKTDGGKAASVFFTDDEKTQANWFTILSLITAIVGCIGIVVAVVGIVMPKFGGYVKYVGALLALLAIVTFIFAIVCTNVYSSSTDVIVASGSFTVKLAVGSILSLIGGLGAAVVPFVLKK